MGSLLNIMTDFFKASTRSLKKFHHKMIYANLMHSVCLHQSLNQSIKQNFTLQILLIGSGPEVNVIKYFLEEI